MDAYARNVELVQWNKSKCSYGQTLREANDSLCIHPIMDLYESVIKKVRKTGGIFLNGKEPEGGAAGSCVDWMVTHPFGKSTSFSYFFVRDSYYVAPEKILVYTAQINKKRA